VGIDVSGGYDRTGSAGNSAGQDPGSRPDELSGVPERELPAHLLASSFRFFLGCGYTARDAIDPYSPSASRASCNAAWISAYPCGEHGELLSSPLLSPAW
jgi:hypothetical protein